MRKRMISIIACLTMLLVNATSSASITVFADETEQLNTRSDAYVSPDSRTITNPRIVKDDSMHAGQKVTWDCIWFGSYPQEEVSDWEAVYSKLQSATTWDSNGDIVLEDSRYRRIKKSDATYATSGESEYYDWADSDSYHYFKYRPIKWRVLKVEGSVAFLMSDIVLDNQRYNQVTENVTWESSTIRSWLNGYGATSNRQAIDYSNRNFIDSAFTFTQKAAIANTALENPDNIGYGTQGGNDTVDKLFLLSEEELYGSNGEVYGFVLVDNAQDESRKCGGSVYAKAMGVWCGQGESNREKCRWWMRSPGFDSNYARYVNDDGSIWSYGWYVSSYNDGVRPVLRLDLSSDIWTDAGAVCSKNGEEVFRVEYDANGGSNTPELQINDWVKI